MILLSSTEKVVEKNEELSDKNRELLEENKNLKDDDKEDDDKEDDESIFKPKKEKKESEEEFRKKTKKALLHISKQIENQEGGTYSDMDKDKKDVIFDNISKEGGKLKEVEDVKNIVVSFF